MVVSAAVLVVGRDSHITAVAVLLSVRGLANACLVGLAVGATSNLVEFSAPRISHSLGWWQGCSSTPAPLGAPVAASLAGLSLARLLLVAWFEPQHTHPLGLTF